MYIEQLFSFKEVKKTPSKNHGTSTLLHMSLYMMRRLGQSFQLQQFDLSYSRL